MVQNESTWLETQVIRCHYMLVAPAWSRTSSDLLFLLEVLKMPKKCWTNIWYVQIVESYLWALGSSQYCESVAFLVGSDASQL